MKFHGFFLLMCITTSAWTHEFWVMPDRFSPAVGEQVTLSLRVGENFVGDPVGFGSPVVDSLRWFNKTEAVDLTPQLPGTLDQDSVILTFERTGSQWISIDTKPFFATLSPDSFNAYLREEGLDQILARRRASGQDDLPGRERYRRHIKTLLTVGGQSDLAAVPQTGQMLEFVPLDEPARLKAGDALRLQVLFDGKPLTDALVKLWHQKEGQITVLRTRTDARGLSITKLPWSGVWMASVVHMVSINDDPQWDWDSHWGNLTFEIRASVKSD